MTPAAFYLSHPDNILRRNRAAGSDSYGFWYNPKSALDTSSDCANTICPENSNIGEFIDNVAHSNGRYGLRIFENLIPREYPCSPLQYSGNPSDPYPTNKPLTAEFRNLVSFKNGRNGAKTSPFQERSSLILTSTMPQLSEIALTVSNKLKGQLILVQELSP
jgi:hypothetical protein